jgi:hypothetical protein
MLRRGTIIAFLPELLQGKWDLRERHRKGERGRERERERERERNVLLMA